MRYLLDGDGADENLKSYPLADSDLTLSSVLGTPLLYHEGFPRTQALFSHFSDVARCEDLRDYSRVGDGVVAPAAGSPPYPMDAAALHHVFDGGWMWVLRFDNGITSAGVAVTDAVAAELRLADGRQAWDRLLARYPTVAKQFARAEPVREFTWMPRVSFRASIGADARWALLPSAAAFVDSLFSTGMPLTLLGIERLAAMMEGGTLPRCISRLHATPPAGRPCATTR